MSATADLGFVPDAPAPGLGFIPDKPTPHVDLGFVPDKNAGGLSDTELQRVLALVPRAAKPAPDDLLVPDIQRDNVRQVALDQPFAAVGTGGKIFQETPQDNPEANEAEFAKLWQASSDVARTALTDAVTTALLPVTYPLYGVQGVAGMEASLQSALTNAFRNTETNPGPEPLPVDVENAQMSGEHPILATIAKVGQSAAGALPLGAAAGAVPAWAGRLMALGFTAQMIADAGPVAQTLGTELGKNPEDRNSDQMTSAAADLVQDFGLAPFAGLHGTRDIIERYADKPMYAIRQLSDQLQNAPIVRTSPLLQPGADIPSSIQNAVPASGAAKVPANSLLEKSNSQKIDDLDAAVKDLQDGLQRKLPLQTQQTINASPDQGDRIVRNIFPVEKEPIMVAKEPKIYGGAYKDIEPGEGENHHTPAASVSTLSKNKGPAVWMEKDDHLETASHGNQGLDGAEYRARQAELIAQGKFDKALQMDIDDIKSKFGAKYDKGLRQMLEYYKTIPDWMLKLQ